MGHQSLGEKFERKKVRIAEKVELFSSKILSSYGSRGATEMAEQLILKLIPNDEEWNYQIGKENLRQSAMLQTLRLIFFLSNNSQSETELSIGQCKGIG